MENNITPKSVLFVCLGNICRSPAGEGILKKYIEDEYLQDFIHVESAGLISYHEGELPDSRMRKAATLRGYKLDSKARKINSQIDFKKFDYIIGMDQKVTSELKRLSESIYSNKIYLMTDFCTKIKATEVPDPYYGDMNDFNYVLDILEDSCKNLYEKVKNDVNSTGN